MNYMYLGGWDKGTEGLRRERKEEKERKLQSKEEPVSIRGTEETWMFFLLCCMTVGWSFNFSLSVSSSVSPHCLHEDQINTVYKRADYKMLCKRRELM